MLKFTSYISLDSRGARGTLTDALDFPTGAQDTRRRKVVAYLLVMGFVALLFPAAAASNAGSAAVQANGLALDSFQNPPEDAIPFLPSSQALAPSATGSANVSFAEFGKVFPGLDGLIPNVTVGTKYDWSKSQLILTMSGNVSVPLTIGLNERWINGHLIDPALVDHPFSIVTLVDVTYFTVAVPNLTKPVRMVWETFSPSRNETQFSMGSSRSIRLQRPMFIRIADVPGWKTVPSEALLGNGTSATVRYAPWLVLDFAGGDRSSQAVQFSREWLASYGIERPRFTHEDGSTIAGSLSGAFVIANVDHFSNIRVDNFEGGCAWTPVKSGGTSFTSAAWTGCTEVAFRSPRYSMEVSFTSGSSDGTDWGQVSSYQETTATDMQMLRVWFYAERWSHNRDPNWDGLEAGVRLRLYDSAGTNFKTVRYWLSAWWRNQDTRTPDADAKLIYAKPPMNRWTEFVTFPKTDWPGVVDWTRVSRIRVEFYANAGGTSGDEFLMYFDDLAYGQTTSKISYVWTASLQRDQIWTDCRSMSFTVPPTAIYVKAWLTFPRTNPVSPDFDLSLWDNLGRRTGAYTRSDRTTRTDIPNSAYDGAVNPETVTVNPPSSSGTWKVGCTLKSGNGHYELRVDVYSSEMLSSDLDGTRYYFQVDGQVYHVDAELRFASSNDYDLSVWDAASRRTGGWIKADKVTRTDIPYSSYSGFSAKPEFVFVDPATGPGLWSVMPYSFSGSGYYEIDVRVKDDFYARFWSVNIHDGDVGSEINRARQTLDNYVVPEGFSHVRMDYRWEAIETSQGVYNRGMVDFYRFFAAAAKDRGMDVIVILDKAPQWAKDLWGSNRAAFWTRLQEYCRFVGAEVGSYVDTYQIGNEENLEGLVQQFSGFPFIDDANLPNLSTYCTNGLSDGESIASGYHGRAFKQAINANVHKQTSPWQDWLKNWVKGAPSSIDVVAIDAYPGTKNCVAFTDWLELNDLMNIVKDPTINKEGAIMETGNSNQGASTGCTPLVSDEGRQARYAWEAIGTIFETMASHNKNNPRNRIILGNWYELIDANSGSGNYEDNFGLLHTDLSAKPAYDVVRAKVADFGRWSAPHQSFGVGLDDTPGGDVAFAQLDGDSRSDAIFMVIDNPAGQNKFYYWVGWNLNPDGTFASLSPRFGPFDAGGDDSQGGGVAIGYVDAGTTLDVLFMNIDIGVNGAKNNYRYRIAYNIQSDGSFCSACWSAVRGPVATSADETDGGGVAFADINKDGGLDAVFMAVKRLTGQDQFVYHIGWNIRTDGTFNSWSVEKGPVGVPTDLSQGGGVALKDWDGDGQLDMIFLVVDNPEKENIYRWVIGTNLNTAGDVAGGWSATWGFQLVPGQENQDGGLAVEDINGDGRLDMLFMAVDNPTGANNVRYRVRLGICGSLG